MLDQQEAAADTTEHTDTVQLVWPTRIQIFIPWIRIPQAATPNCTTIVSRTWVKGHAGRTLFTHFPGKEQLRVLLSH
jgi:hypothetical protein